MKKIDVDKDYKRTRFLIVAMVIQIVVVFVLLAAYVAWLRWETPPQGRRATRSISTKAPTASAVTPIQVRAGNLPVSK